MAQATPIAMTLLSDEYNVPCAAFTSNGQLVAVSGGLSNPAIAIWDLSGPTLVAEVETYYVCGAIAFSPGGNQLARGVQSGGLNEHIVLILWDLADLDPVGGLLGWVDTNDLEFSPDGSLLARANGIAEIFDVGNLPHFEGSMLHGYDTPRNEPIAVFSHVPVDEQPLSGQYVTRVAFAPDGASLATGTWKGTVATWNVSSGVKMREIQIKDPALADQGAAVTALAYSPNGSQLVIGTSNLGMYIWDFALETLEIIVGQGEQSSALAFSEGGDLFISGHEDTLRLWRTEDFEMTCEFSIPPSIITAVAISEELAKAYATTLAGSLYSFDLGAGCLLFGG